ncbi:hypothetical protein, partial [Phytoactinopolyspora endophytica]|uniref:hypothetical protein n=1 Tax=Phytoactinopolyspora endophytica TaxID=1642495 RepID=UPI00197C39C0
MVSPSTRATLELDFSAAPIQWLGSSRVVTPECCTGMSNYSSTRARIAISISICPNNCAVDHYAFVGR